MTFGIISESDREGRAVCQSWLPGGKHNVTPTDKIPSSKSPMKIIKFTRFDRSRKVPAVLNGGMRINYRGAYPPGNGGCTELLTGVVVLNRDEKTASVLPHFGMLS